MQKHTEKYYNNRSKILDCFIALINNEGYNYATINQVSKITGLSYGSITNIFNTKEDILLEVLKVNIEKYRKKVLNHSDRLVIFLSNIVEQIKRIETDENFKIILLEQFSLPKTTTYLKNYITELLMDSIYDTRDCYFKSIAIVGIIREYVNTDLNQFLYLDKKIENLIEDILLICKYNDSEIELIKTKLY